MKKTMFVFLLIFSLLIVSGKEYRCESKDKGFNEIEKYLIEEYGFVQNGIKLEYTTEETLEEEYSRIENLLRDKSDLLVSGKENYMYADSENSSYNISMYSYKDQVKVEVVILNSDSNRRQDELEQEAKEIRGLNFKDERIFSFIKSGIGTNEKDITNELKTDLNIKINEVLDINNGYVAKATIGNDESINIGKVSYDTGSYLIIGTPIIFITY